MAGYFLCPILLGVKDASPVSVHFSSVTFIIATLFPTLWHCSMLAAAGTSAGVEAYTPMSIGPIYKPCIQGL